MKHIAKLIFVLTVMVLYQEATIRWAAAPPPPEPALPAPGTPIGNSLMHLTTIAGVLGYGVWKFWKK